ncbi:MAG: hypothetical protein ABSA75_10835 [Candidatus Bathyarchaeia archaeon]|jgi:hypothetical protein
MYDGYVLFCNKTSQQQCLSRKRYTCADKESTTLEEIKAGSVVFLYNTDDKSLLGPFTTLAEGDELDAGTWVMDVDKHIPSEDVRVTWEDLHIIQNAPEKLPFLNDPKTCKLSTTQTQRVLDLLREGPLYLYAKNQKRSS